MIPIVLLLLAALLVLPVSRWLTGDYFSPPALVTAVWCGTLALCLLYWIPYVVLQPATLTLIGQTVALLAGASAVAAWAMACVTRARPNVDGVNGDRADITPTLPGARWWVLFYSVLAIAGFAWYVHGVVTHLGWDAFTQAHRLRVALSTYEIPSRFLFLQYFCLAAPLFAFALWLTGARVGWPLLTLAGLAGLTTLGTTDRTQFFTLALTVFFMDFFRRGPRVTVTRFVSLCIVCPLILVLNFVAVSMWRTVRMDVPISTPAWRTATSPAVGRAVDQFALFYFYATSSYPALDVLLRQPRANTGGLHTFHPIARFLQRARIVQTSLPPYIAPFLPVTRDGVEPPLVTNVYTFLYYPLEDFDVAGTLTYSGAIGVICGVVYGLGRGRRDSAAYVLAIGHLSTALTLSVFVNKFNNTGWWYVLVLTLAPFALAAGTRVVVRRRTSGNDAYAR